MRLGRHVSLVVGVGSLLAGCFYVDPINQRPMVMATQRLCDGGDPTAPCDFSDLHHGDSVTLKAVFSDPDGNVADAVVQWTVLACDSTATMCNGIGLEGPAMTPTFVVPSTLENTGGPVQAVSVAVDVFDGRGASNAGDTLKIPINDGPTLALSRSARTYTVGAPIELFATYGDPDSGPVGTPPSTVTLAWAPLGPDNEVASTTPIEVSQDSQDPGHLTAGMLLVPQAAGDWDVRVIATNSHGKMDEQHLRFTVDVDQPPCLAQWEPIVPPDGETLPITAPTVFQIPLVDDDLDPYPAVPSEPGLGTTAFAWSILPPGATARQPLVGATGNSIDFDPSAFTPGEIVELRVEIFDRSHPVVACPDGDPVCLASPECNQRQTWRVEIR